MLRKIRSSLATGPVLRKYAPVFNALGDETRLTLLARLCERSPCSISELAAGSEMTRQAITKHLRVLQDARLVESETAGRENLFVLKPEPLTAAQNYLSEISQQWNSALARLKAFVEK